MRSTTEPKNKELYLRGLAACGVEYQDCNGEISFEGVSEKELIFLSKVPSLIRPKFNYIVKNIFPELSQEDINFHATKSICETRFSQRLISIVFLIWFMMILIKKAYWKLVLKK